MAGGMNVCAAVLASAFPKSGLSIFCPRRSATWSRLRHIVRRQHGCVLTPCKSYCKLTQGQESSTLPKVQLHIHLDGAVRHKTLWNYARKRGIISQEKTFQEYLQIFQNCERGDLQKFLANFNEILPVIRGDPDIISQVAYELCEDQAKDGALYFEARYCPHLLASPPPSRLQKPGGDDPVLTPRDVVIAVNDGIKRGCRDFGVKGRTILCLMRRKPEISQDIIALCQEFRDDTVVGIDLAGDEKALSTKEHEDAFKIAEEQGIHRTVHAGELGPAENVRFAIERLGAQRIGHGYQIANDQHVYEMVQDRCIHLEVCPTSSLYTGAWKGRLEDHCIIRFVRDGLNVGLNTDDPTILFNSMETEFQLARDYFSMDDTQLAETTLNAARASFLRPQERSELVRELQARLHPSNEHGSC